VDAKKSNREKLAVVLQRLRGRAVLLAMSEWKTVVAIILNRREMLAQIVKDR